MTNLAFKEHPKRGREVIRLLEMLGGNNNYSRYCGHNIFTNTIYYIDYNDRNFIKMIENPSNISDFIVFTIEEFEEKFPYKVGDKVSILAGTNYVFTIKSMTWDTDQVIYKIKSIDGIEYDKHDWIADELIYYTEHKEETMEESDEKAVNHVYDTEVISFDIAQRDKYELDLQGKFEVVLREGKYYVERIKPQYPKTYKECCKVLGISRDDVEIDLPHPYQQKMFNLFKPHICRDAYWKVYGEQMGLGKPWEPDWTNTNSNKYCIYYVGNEIKKQPMLEVHHFLAFPTKEIRDIFFENFKDLIEQCKELLK